MSVSQAEAAQSGRRLEVAHVSKTFGPARVLRDVGLRIAPGELHGLVGQNGCGKSTLVKILTGIYTPDSGGAIAVDGLGRLKSNSMVKAVVVVDQAYAGWALSDEILRMATKSAPVNETFPSRLFTSQNIGSIQVTTGDQASGAWFGDSSYQTAFEKLWGL